MRNRTIYLFILTVGVSTLFCATAAFAQYGGGGGGGDNSGSLLGLSEGHLLQFRPFSFSFSTDSGYDSAANTHLFAKGNGNNGNNNGKNQLESSFYAGFD